MYSLLIENDRTLKNYQDSRENHKDANLIRVFNAFKQLSDFWFVSQKPWHMIKISKNKKLALVHDWVILTKSSIDSIFR